MQFKSADRIIFVDFLLIKFLTFFPLFDLPPYGEKLF